jgi:hypothetical protein
MGGGGVLLKDHWLVVSMSSRPGRCGGRGGVVLLIVFGAACPASYRYSCTCPKYEQSARSVRSPARKGLGGAKYKTVSK